MASPPAIFLVGHRDRHQSGATPSGRVSARSPGEGQVEPRVADRGAGSVQRRWWGEFGDPIVWVDGHAPGALRGIDALRFHEPVVMAAEQDEVVEIGGSAVPPWPDVVGLGFAGWFSQPGKAQPPSRRISAWRQAPVASRRSRPRSRIWPSLPRTAGRILAWQASRRISATEMGSLVVSSSALPCPCWRASRAVRPGRLRGLDGAGGLGGSRCLGSRCLGSTCLGSRCLGFRCLGAIPAGDRIDHDRGGVEHRELGRSGGMRAVGGGDGAQCVDHDLGVKHWQFPAEMNRAAAVIAPAEPSVPARSALSRQQSFFVVGVTDFRGDDCDGTPGESQQPQRIEFITAGEDFRLGIQYLAGGEFLGQFPQRGHDHLGLSGFRTLFRSRKGGRFEMPRPHIFGAPAGARDAAAARVLFSEAAGATA